MPNTGNDALSLDSNGNLYVSHYGKGSISGDTVYKIGTDGSISEGVSGLNRPLGIDFDSNGNIYIAGGNIQKVSPDGAASTFSNFSSASGIVITPQNELYVSSYTGNKIYKVTSAGDKEVWVRDNGLNGPVGIAYDESGNVYVGNYEDGKIFKISSDKTFTQLGSVSGGIGYITYSNGIIYATARAKNKIYKVAVTGGATEVLEGSSGGGFSFPNGITVSNDGTKMFVSNYNSSKIVLIENFDDQVAAVLQVHDDNAIVDQNAEVIIDILSNDSSGEGAFDKTSVNITTLAENGMTSIDNITGSVTYTPNSGFSGADSIAYTVNNTDGETSNEATVSISIVDTTTVPQAQDESVTLQQDAEIVIEVLSNDNEAGGTLDLTSIDIVTLPENGVTTINNTVGNVTYTPNAGFSGTDSFAYTVKNPNGDSSNEAVVSITISEKTAETVPPVVASPTPKSGGGSFGLLAMFVLLLTASKKVIYRK